MTPTLSNFNMAFKTGELSIIILPKPAAPAKPATIPIILTGVCPLPGPLVFTSEPSGCAILAADVPPNLPGPKKPAALCVLP